MKEMLSKAFNRKENKQPITFLVNIKQIIKIEEEKIDRFSNLNILSEDITEPTRYPWATRQPLILSV